VVDMREVVLVVVGSSVVDLGWLGRRKAGIFAFNNRGATVLRVAVGSEEEEGVKAAVVKWRGEPWGCLVKRVWAEIKMDDTALE